MVPRKLQAVSRVGASEAGCLVRLAAHRHLWAHRMPLGAGAVFGETWALSFQKAVSDDLAAFNGSRQQLLYVQAEVESLYGDVRAPQLMND
jgi:hypothetical protein